jgi:signal transduction histidine kinase
MLRKKLLFNLGPLVGLLLLTAIVAIWLLQGVLRDFDHVNTQAWHVVEQVNELSINVNAIEVDLYELQLGKQRHLDGLIDRVESTQQIVDGLKDELVVNQPAASGYFRMIQEEMPVFRRHVAALATVQDPQLAQEHGERAMNAAVSLRQNTLPLSRYVRDHAHAEHESLTAWFRSLVLALAIVFLLLINISVIVLLRMGSMIVQPVEKLLGATRELGSEHFEYRVRLDQKDEFDELARAYNSLAEQLQANERKRIETLAQAAVTMNHELNNAISIIDLQLSVLGRQTTGNPALEKCLRQIHESLERVTSTVQSLKNVRRIVLTDYIPGTKMLDLQRCVQQEDDAAASAAAAASAHREAQSV